VHENHSLACSQTDVSGRLRRQENTVEKRSRRKGFADLQIGKLDESAVAAWLGWAAVHAQSLAASSLGLSVFLQWVSTYLAGQRGSRLIVKHYGSELENTGAEQGVRTAVSGK
jgi:hypothetical protein